MDMEGTPRSIPTRKRCRAVGQNQWYHFGVGAPLILVYFSGDWDVHWGYGILTHSHMEVFFVSGRQMDPRPQAKALVLRREPMDRCPPYFSGPFGRNAVPKPIPRPPKSAEASALRRLFAGGGGSRYVWFPCLKNTAQHLVQ